MFEVVFRPIGGRVLVGPPRCVVTRGLPLTGRLRHVNDMWNDCVGAAVRGASEGAVTHGLSGGVTTGLIDPHKGPREGCGRNWRATAAIEQGGMDHG